MKTFEELFKKEVEIADISEELRAHKSLYDKASYERIQEILWDKMEHIFNPDNLINNK